MIIGTIILLFGGIPIFIALRFYNPSTYNRFWLYATYYSIFMLFAGPALYYWIAYDKQVNDPIRLSRIKAATDYKQVTKVIDVKLDSVLKEYSFISVYTNDTSLQEAAIKINQDIMQDYSVIDFVNTNSIIYDLKDFLEREDTLGYNVFIHAKNGWQRLQNLTDVTSKKEFKVSNDFQLTDIQYDYLVQNSISGSKRDIKRHRQYAIVFDDGELLNHKVNSSLKALMQPNIDLSNPTMLFYFSAYNHYLTPQQFQKQLPHFKSMFLKNQKCDNCFIRTIKIKKVFLD